MVWGMRATGKYIFKLQTSRKLVLTYNIYCQLFLLAPGGWTSESLHNTCAEANEFAAVNGSIGPLTAG